MRRLNHLLLLATLCVVAIPESAEAGWRIDLLKSACSNNYLCVKKVEKLAAKCKTEKCREKYAFILNPR
jgi:hypothetical protein